LPARTQTHVVLRHDERVTDIHDTVAVHVAAHDRQNEHAVTVGARVDRARRRRVYREGVDAEVGQAGIDRRPARSPVRALEHPATVRARVEGAGRRRVDRQGGHLGVGQASADRRPVRPGVRALEHPATLCARVERAGRRGVDRQGRDIPALWPDGGPSRVRLPCR